MRQAAFLLSAFFISMAGLRATEEITNDQFGFSVKVPDPFFQTETGAGQPDAIYTFLDKKPDPQNRPVMITIQRLRGVIDPHQRLSADKLPKKSGISATLETLDWRGLKLDVLRQAMDKSVDRPAIVVYNVQFPLQKEAVQMSVAGPVEKDEQARVALKAAAADFKNLKALHAPKSATPGIKTLTPEERTPILMRGIAFMAIAAAVIFAILRSIFRLFRKSKR